MEPEGCGHQRRVTIPVVVIAVLLVATAVFFLIPKSSMLDIRTEPVEGAIYIDDRLVGIGSARIPLSLGSHMVSFGEVPGYDKLPSRRVDLTEGGAMVVAIYIRQTGVLAIQTMTPLKMPGVTTSLIALYMGKLYLNGTFIGEGQLCITMETGYYKLEFGDVPGFVTPAPIMVKVTNGSSETITAIYTPKFQNISVQAARQLIEINPLLRIIDVRGPDEYKMGHLKGAVNVPFPMLKGRMAELDKSREMLMYRASGMVSVLAAGMLHAEGFKVYHMDGGIIDWVSAGYELINSTLGEEP